jgi:hypothetical protein
MKMAEITFDRHVKTPLLGSNFVALRPTRFCDSDAISGIASLANKHGCPS